MPDQTSLADSDLALLEQAKEGCAKLRSELAKVIVGQAAAVRPVVAAVFAQGHTLIIGVPGLAKTLLVRTLAQALSWSFKRIQFTPDMMPADILGMELLQEDPASGSRAMRFVPGPIFAQLVLADEINRTPPKTQSALLEAMQEYTVTSLGKAHALERPFIVFATQNPIEQEGTYPLPEAQLDRFMFSLWMTYPTAEEECEIVAATTEDVQTTVSPVFSSEQIVAFQHLVRRVPASRNAVQFAVSIARATRPDDPSASKFVKEYVAWGAGPRASQNLILGAKALAVMDGLATVSLEHVREVAPLVLRHRVLPNYNATGDGIDSAKIIQKVVSQLDSPFFEA